ncbi:hypothetical protein ALC57_05104 [Trachymyrmex cornetzi]|uniref:Uncharacterized protein n=1 Tax=Trachymyrmex cornetzi TaxID=471704 RepID=A0A151JBJ1_9HYME|nr:hypothetical protein ALC57_05104 [Trachymyrmex cornetzi]
MGPPRVASPVSVPPGSEPGVPRKPKALHTSRRPVGGWSPVPAIIIPRARGICLPPGGTRGLAKRLAGRVYPGRRSRHGEWVKQKMEIELIETETDNKTEEDTRSKTAGKEIEVSAVWSEAPGSEQTLPGTSVPVVRLESLSQGPKATGIKESGSSHSFFKKPGPRSYKGRTAEPSYMDSSAIDTETQEISSDSDISEHGRTKGRGRIVDDDSDTSPPEKVNIGSRGPQRTRGNRKRERITSEVESEYRKSRTTGDYIGRREAIQKFNEAKEEALQLERERIIREYSNFELFKKSKIDLDKIKDQMEVKSTEDLATRVTENLSEVLRIAKSMAACSVNDPKMTEMTQDSTIESMKVDNPQEWKTPEATFTQGIDWPEHGQNWNQGDQATASGKEGEGGISIVNNNG